MRKNEKKKKNKRKREGIAILAFLLVAKCKRTYFTNERAGKDNFLCKVIFTIEYLLPTRTFLLTQILNKCTTDNKLDLLI